MGIGFRIKEAREKKGLNQKQLGKLLGVTGAAIGNYENEISHPKEPILYKLLEVLEVDANYLFQDCFSKKLLSQPVLSLESMEVVKAYEKASFKDKNIARQALDLPPLEPPAKEVSLSDDRKFAV